MSVGSATTPQLVFGALCAVTGILGTWLQVIGQRYTQRGGPQESPVLAVLGGPGSPWNQLIFINDRGSVAAFGAMLGNMGAAVLFASVVAGLTINFPGLWPLGVTLYALTLIFGAGRILYLGTVDLWQTRLIQEWMFEKLPADGTVADSGPGRPPVLSDYRLRILALKPDLGEAASRKPFLLRPLMLYRFVHNTLHREDAARRKSYAEAIAIAAGRNSAR